jgi:hypothetical protein
MLIIEIILRSNTAYVTIVPDLCQTAIQEIQRNDMHILTKNVIIVLHILVCTKWIVYLDLWVKHWISARVTK